MAQPMAASPANPRPAGLMAPCHGCVSRTTPIAATAGEASARVLWLRTAATVSGPRNSTATAVPSGMRSIAARNTTVTRPVATPRPSSAGTSRERTARSGGRARARKMSAPMLSLSQAVPAGPTAGIRRTDRAEPSWTDSIAARASPHGGTTAERRARVVM